MGDCLRGGSAAYRGAMRHLLVALLLAACSADPVIAPRDCTPGTTAACACLGASGVQTCTAAGTVGACECPDAGGGDVVAVPDAPMLDAAVPEDRLAPMDAGAVADVATAPDVVDAGPVMLCGDASVNVLNGDRQPSGVFTHCGACGRTCAVGERCSAGSCGPTCPNGPTAICDGRTVDLQIGSPDGGIRYHCGACGNHCGAGEFCINCVCTR